MIFKFSSAKRAWKCIASSSGRAKNYDGLLRKRTRTSLSQAQLVTRKSRHVVLDTRQLAALDQKFVFA